MLGRVFSRQRPDFARLGSHQEGDTIVEVLIAIAIVSLILTAAYVITNKNTIAIQNNQERIQAQHIVAGQIESLRAQDGLTSGQLCFNDSGVAETSASYCDAITKADSGATYKARISAPVNNVYTVSVTWSSLGGTKEDDSNITMYYRLHL